MASVQSHADGFEANQAFQVAINITNTKEVNLNVGDSFTHNESINMRSMSKPLTTIKYRGELEYNDMTIDSANGINVSEHMEYRALTVKNMEKNSTFHLKNRLVLSNTARVVNLKDGSGNKKIYEAQIASKNKEPTLILCSWDEPLNAPVGKLVEGYYLTCKLWKRSLEFQVNQFSSLFAYDQEPTNFGSQSSSSSSSTSTGAGINISLVVMNVEVPTEELYCGVVPVELPVTYSDLDNAIELVLSNVPDCKVVCIMETMADSEEFVITEENCTAAIDLNSRLKVKSARTLIPVC